MPKGLLQEKMQRTVEPEKPEDHQWASFEKQRVVYEHPEQTYSSSRPAANQSHSFKAPKTNMLPPGMFPDNQEPGVTVLSDGGLAGSTDVSNSVNAKMLERGYQRQKMSNTDEMYTNEHIEEFYGDATVDGDTGFLERNNYLDRN